MEYVPYQTYGARRPVVVLNFGKWTSIAMGLCILVFLLELVSADFMFRNFALVSGAVLARPWTLLTHVFMHGGSYHLLMNMFALFLFGFILEREAGSYMFLTAFFGAGLIAALGQLAFTEPGVVSVGASGAIFGVMGMLAVLKPRMMVYVNFIPVPMVVAVVGWGIANLLMINTADSVGHAAHFFGLLFGLGLGMYWRFIRKTSVLQQYPSQPQSQQFRL